MVLKLKLAPGGGSAIRLVPARSRGSDKPESLRPRRLVSWKPMSKWIVALLSGLTLAAAQPADPNAVKEVLAASEALKQAMMAKDTAGVQKYLHDDLIYSHSHGQNQTKADLVQATKGKATIEAIDFSDVNVRVYGTTALIKANCDMRNRSEGKAAVTSHLNVLLVWLKGPGGWQLVSRQSTLLETPAQP